MGTRHGMHFIILTIVTRNYRPVVAIAIIFKHHVYLYLETFLPCLSIQAEAPYEHVLHIGMFHC